MYIRKIKKFQENFIIEASDFGKYLKNDVISSKQKHRLNIAVIFKIGGKMAINTEAAIIKVRIQFVYKHGISVQAFPFSVCVYVLNPQQLKDRLD